MKPKYLLFLIISFIYLCPKVYANSIENIDMDIYVDQNGTANVTEVWSTTIDSGTEGYKPYNNLNNSQILDFKVSDESGKEYTYQEDWDTFGTFEEKKYQNGINDKGFDTELCWGISEYGSKTYTLTYKITNFINQYTDNQGIYFELLPQHSLQEVQNVDITIKADFLITDEIADIFAFGYPRGTINFVDGAIEMDSNGYVYTGEYMVALVGFDNGLFQTTNNVPQTFMDTYNEAMIGVTDVPVDDFDYQHVIPKNAIYFIALGIIFVVISIIIPQLFITGIITLFFRLFGLGVKKQFAGEYPPTMNESTTDLKLDEVDYYRDIPCNKDVLRAYWVAYKYNMVTDKACLIGALVLHWLKNGTVKVVKGESSFFSRKDKYVIDLKETTNNGDNAIEKQLLSLLRKASGDNRILEQKELEKYCRKNYYLIDIWFSSAIAYETSELTKEGKVTRVESGKADFFGASPLVDVIDDSMQEEAIQLLGLKKFLLDFSTIEKKEAIEVKLWEEYLIFAEILGIADKVENQFRELYPEFSKVSSLNLDYATITVRAFANIGYQIAAISFAHAQQLAAAQKVASKFDDGDTIFSGSGGSFGGGSGGSSHSGGGGSAGGSSSGGGFR